MTPLLPMESEKKSLHSQIGQLFALSIPLNVAPDQLEQLCAIINKYSIGSVMLDQKGTLCEQAHIINTINEKCPHHPLILEDLEWGLTMRISDGVRFPRAMTCGAITENDLIFRMAEEIGRQCRLVGVDVNLAPVLDINCNPKNPVINDRSFGERKESVAQKGIEYIRGLTTQEVTACGKHVPGHGDSTVDSHLDLPLIDHTRERILSIELYPFRETAAILPSMMLAHLSIPALDSEALCATVSKKIINGILREELKFQGTIITDALRMRALTKHLTIRQIALQSFLAGNDLLLCPDNIQEAITSLQEAYENGTISEEEINRRVTKIRSLKHRKTDIIDADTIFEQIHTPEAYRLKKELFESAVTLVQNQNSLIPLSSTDKTISLQIGGSLSLITHIVNSQMQNYLSSTPDWRELAYMLETIDPYQNIIISLFEVQKFDFASYGIAPATRALIKKIMNRGKRVILAVFGTPYCLKFFHKVPTIIMAYEDDPDAQEAAAKIITGELTARGKLPVSVSEIFPEGLGL